MKKKRVLSILIVMTLIISCFPGELGKKVGMIDEVKADGMISDPRIVSDDSMKAGQKVTWDCIWFGSYPQTEIVNKVETCGTYGNKYWGSSADYAVDASTYSTLQNASGWDSNGDITLNGTRYRRIKKADAIYSGSSNNYYSWSDSDTYHYFRYEPIKWRVLMTSGNSAFLMADEAIDCQKYNNKTIAGTWEASTIRTWLNENFFKSAFSSSEQGAIMTTSVVNNENIHFGTAGGSDTDDKVFLLSEAEVYTDTAKSYGFVSENDTNDEARRCKSTSYAKAMGAWSDFANSEDYEYSGNCCWWLRSPGRNYSSSNCAAVYVNSNGLVSYYGGDIYDGKRVVRPALNLNLSSSDLYSYAGTVCSDGTDTEVGGETEPEVIESEWFNIPNDTNNFDNDLTDFYYGEYKTEDQLTATEKKNIKGYLKKHRAYNLSDDYSIGYYILTDSMYIADPHIYTYGLSDRAFEKFTSTLKKKADIAAIKDHMNDGWAGACRGIAITMALANQGIDLEENGIIDSYYYLSGLPKNNKKLRDAIFYYQIQQYAPTTEYSEATYSPKYHPILQHFHDRRSLHDYLDYLVDTAIDYTENKMPFIFTYGYPGESGHSILAFDIMKKGNDTYAIKMYNMNNKKVITCKVDLSTDSFCFPDSYGGIVNEDNYDFLSYSTLGLVYGGDPTRNIKSSTEENNYSRIIVSSSNRFTITNDRGEYLSFDGEQFSGDMDIYDIYNIQADGGANNKRTISFKVDPYESLTMSNFDTETELNGIINGEYYTATVEGADSFVFSENQISIQGEDYTFTGGTTAGIDSDNLYKVAAEAQGDVTLTAGNDTLSVNSDGELSDAVVAAYGDSSAEYTDVESDNGSIQFNTNKIDPEKETASTESKTKPTKVSKITLAGISHNIAAGKKIQLKATVLPKTAKNKKLKWTSSDTKVATVTQTGKVSIKKGTGGKSVTITAQATDGSGVSASYKIKVMKASVKKKLLISGTMTPIVFDVFCVKVRADTEGRYLFSSTTFRILCFVSSFTYPFPVSTLETVEVDTPAFNAISFIVIMLFHTVQLISCHSTFPLHISVITPLKPALASLFFCSSLIHSFLSDTHFNSHLSGIQTCSLS